MADEMEYLRAKCGFFLKRINRYCKMIPGKRKKYCGEHCYLSEENDVRADCFFINIKKTTK